MTSTFYSDVSVNRLPSEEQAGSYFLLLLEAHVLEAKQARWRAQEPQLPGASGAQGPVLSTTRSPTQRAVTSLRWTDSAGLQERPIGKQTTLWQGRPWY